MENIFVFMKHLNFNFFLDRVMGGTTRVVYGTAFEQRNGSGE